MSSLSDGDVVVGFDFGYQGIIGCRLRVDSQSKHGFRIEAWETIELNGTLGKMTQQLVGAHSTLLQGNHFILERQTAQKPQLYGLSHVLHCLLIERNPGAYVAHMAPMTKFAVLDPDKLTAPVIGKVRKYYNGRKNWAVQLCEGLIVGQSNESIAPFRSAEKRDDLSDAFLYARTFVEQKEP